MTGVKIQSETIIDFREKIWSIIEQKNSWDKNEIKEALMQAEICLLRKYYTMDPK